MSRGGYKITRCSDQHEVPGNSQDSSIPSWMNEFAAKAKTIVESSEIKQKEAVTVVDRARDRNATIYEQMYAIMNGKKPLYSSVEEAVSDYQSKTGLKNHLQSIQSESMSVHTAAHKILEASDGLDEKKNSEEPIAFTIVPQTKVFIDGFVRKNPSLSVPAILHILAERFETDGLSSAELDDPVLSHYINQLLITNAPQKDSSMVGDGADNYSDNENNNDVFEVLRPSNMHY